jgi:hypothetical protein
VVTLIAGVYFRRRWEILWLFYYVDQAAGELKKAQDDHLIRDAPRLRRACAHLDTACNHASSCFGGLIGSSEGSRERIRELRTRTTATLRRIQKQVLSGGRSVAPELAQELDRLLQSWLQGDWSDLDEVPSRVGPLRQVTRWLVLRADYLGYATVSSSILALTWTVGSPNVGIDAISVFCTLALMVSLFLVVSPARAPGFLSHLRGFAPWKEESSEGSEGEP